MIRERKIKVCEVDAIKKNQKDSCTFDERVSLLYREDDQFH